MVQLYKPDWLRTWLDNLNWDILGWQVYVGDAVEQAIDWVLGWISALTEWAEQIGAWWEDFRQEVIDAFNAIGEFIGEQLQPLVDFFNNFWEIMATWWADRLIEVYELMIDFLAPVGDWWQARVEDIRNLIDSATLWLQDRVDNLAGLVSYVSTAWDHFRLNILPTLAPYEFVEQAIQELLASWSDLFNWWASFRDEVLEFFADPWAWLYNKFDDFIERFW